MTPAEVDTKWMRYALELAKDAARAGEVPVGAVIVRMVGDDPERWPIAGQSGNLKEIQADPLGHAEIIAIRAATEWLGTWRLTDCRLYVTLEPCVMCAGAIVHARLAEVVYGAVDPKAGAVQSLYQILNDTRLNHRPRVRSQILADECSKILSEFFLARRLAKKSPVD